MKRLLRSRLPQPLTSDQISSLTEQSHLPKEDIEDWYERFNHCYPRGYVSYKEFITYLQQVQIRDGNKSRPTKSLVKELFHVLDLNEDNRINFIEFFLFNLLLNHGSLEEKLKLILRLYDGDEKKYLTRQELENVLTSMFDLLTIPKPKNGLSQTIDTILTRENFKRESTKISWHSFRTYVLNDPSIFKLLVPKDDHDDWHDDESFYIITTRF